MSNWKEIIKNNYRVLTDSLLSLICIIILAVTIKLVGRDLENDTLIIIYFLFVVFFFLSEELQEIKEKMSK